MENADLKLALEQKSRTSTISGWDSFDGRGLVQQLQAEIELYRLQLADVGLVTWISNRCFSLFARLRSTSLFIFVVFELDLSCMFFLCVVCGCMHVFCVCIWCGFMIIADSERADAQTVRKLHEQQGLWKEVFRVASFTLFCLIFINCSIVHFESWGTTERHFVKEWRESERWATVLWNATRLTRFASSS